MGRTYKTVLELLDEMVADNPHHVLYSYVTQDPTGRSELSVGDLSCGARAVAAEL